jgi:tetratricopeptide (TPR) repeat protein
MTLRKQNDFRGARTYYERALTIDEERYGPGHPNVAIDLNNLGHALANLGDVDAALQHFERALGIFLEHLGEKHPFTLAVKQSLRELDKRAERDPSS